MHQEAKARKHGFPMQTEEGEGRGTVGRYECM